ncbi:hypothetical protein E1A91_A07G094200v1 [Gossypium mustelinum]|uniref:Uncharacterized protein n=1 Tax=Gossypium mustelinum TaxID=34275 RepID=A0A5D2YJN6_GOSMU|nr:hypothetical protein E1A91_A07G094200v1 [Gossypium mustelinum]
MVGKRTRSNRKSSNNLDVEQSEVLQQLRWFVVDFFWGSVRMRFWGVD